MNKRIHETIVERTTVAGIPSWGIFDKELKKPEVYVSYAGQPTNTRLILFQCNKTDGSHDVLEVTVGQAYDLLQVVSRALSKPVKGF